LVLRQFKALPRPTFFPRRDYGGFDYHPRATLPILGFLHQTILVGTILAGEVRSLIPRWLWGACSVVCSVVDAPTAETVQAETRQRSLYKKEFGKRFRNISEEESNSW